MAEYRETKDGKRYRQIISADDVDAAVLTAAESALEWFTDDEQRIDWEDFLERMDKYLPDDYELPELDNPAVRKIKRHIRDIRGNS